MSVEILVVNGRARGTIRTWYGNGRLAEKRGFDDDGRLTVVRRWSEDGSPVPLSSSGAARGYGEAGP